MRFVVSKSIDLGEEKLDEWKVSSGFYRSLKSFFPDSRIVKDTLSASLDGFFEHGVIKADINWSIKNQKLFIEIEGKSRMGVFSIIGLCTIPFIGGIIRFILIGYFVPQLVIFLLSRNLPKKNIEESIDAFKLKLEKNPEEFISKPVQ